jgi:hypothetical protein
MKKLFFVVILVYLTLPVFTQESYSVISDSLNVREGPGTNYDVLGRVYKGEFVKVLEIGGDWAKIIFKDSAGYVNKKFILAQKQETEAPPELEIIEKNEDTNYIIALIFLCTVIILLLIIIHVLKTKASRYNNENSRINKEIDNLKANISNYKDEYSKIYNENSGLHRELEQVKERSLVIENNNITLENGFDIFDFDTWEYASDSREFRWNGKNILDKDDNPASEKAVVDLFRAIYNFLERNGDILPVDEKINGIKNMLNRMDKLKSDPEYYAKQEAELDKEIPDGLFNPRDPDTYQFAKNKPLVIDGIQIYNTYIDSSGIEEKEVKKNETEKGFVRSFAISLKIQKNVIAWEEAIKLVKPDFTFEGKEPAQETPGYMERANEVYHSILKNPAVRLTKEQERKYIENYINQKIDLCSPMPPVIKFLGGHGFTQAQLEVLGSLPDEDIAAIGKTMSSGLRGRKLEQALFNAHGSLNMNWHHLAELYNQNVAWEKKVMHDFYLGYELETEEEINKLLDESEYLKDHNELKTKIYEHFKEKFIDDCFTELYDDLEIKEDVNELINRNEYVKHHPVFKANLLEKFEGFILKDREDQNKSIDIKNFAIHDDIKQLLWFADGPLKNLTKEQMAHDKDAISLKIQFEPNNLRVAVCEKLNLTMDEPSLIYTKKAIIQPQDGLNVPVPYYFPRYKDFSPEQRWMYLKFLANPYNANFDIGYVFVLYYGLERHLLQGDFDNAFKVIIKLRDVYTNKSFQKYSGNAIILSALLKNKGEYAIKFVKSLDTDYKFCFSDNLLLLCYYSFNIPLIPRELMRMTKTFEFTKTNYIKKSPAVFEQCLLDTIKEKMGSENIDIKKYITDSELDNLSYENIPVYVNSSIIGNTIPVPMLTSNSRLRNEINILLESAHMATKAKLAEMRKAARNTAKSERMSIEEDDKK